MSLGVSISGVMSVTMHPSSINARLAAEYRAKFYIFHEKVKTSQVYIRDCSPVSPSALMLFGGALSPELQQQQRQQWQWLGTHWQATNSAVPEEAVLSIDDWIRFTVSSAQARLLLGVRGKLDALLKRKIEKPEEHFHTSPSR